MTLDDLAKQLPRKLASSPASLDVLARLVVEFSSDVFDFARLIIEQVRLAQSWEPPAMTTAQRQALRTPANATLVYDTDLAALCLYVPAVGWHSLDMTPL